MKVLILDAYNLLYRARFAASRNAPPGDHAITYVFFRSLRPLIEKFKPDVAYFVLEGTPTHRLAIQPDYKGTRDKTPDEGFNRQRDEIISLMAEYLPINIVRHPMYEADDIVANLIEHRHSDHDVTVVSSDTDFIQLLDRYEQVKLYNPVQKKFRSAVGVDYVKYKSLLGDGCDNIKGFNGIGDKRARALLENTDKMKEFLKIDGHTNKFEQNQIMIKFHYLDDLNQVDEHHGQSNWEMLRKQFTNFMFFSITNNTSWGKFVRTFNSLEDD